MIKLLHGIHHGIQDVLDLLESTQVFIIPIVNPDGVAYIEHKEKTVGRIPMKRKNGREMPDCNSETLSGIDINRNYGNTWNKAMHEDDDFCTDQYHGTGPFSEPESRTIRDFILGH